MTRLRRWSRGARSRLTEKRLKLIQRREVLVHRAEAHPHRVTAEIRRAKLAPAADILRPHLRRLLLERYARVDAERRRVATLLAQVAAQRLHHRAPALRRDVLRDPAVAIGRH